jgi:acetylornithine deacetylase/succinyl-diaminopimelate desuccinylase-like protein
MKIAALVAGALLAAPAFAAGEVHPLIADSRVKSALQFLRDDDARTLAEQIAIAQVPAPPFKESVRAQDFAARLREAGLRDVSIDAAGNVIAKRPGTAKGKGPLLVLSAHLDTVFDEGTDLTVKEQDGRYSAPGIADDARGLAALLSLARAMQAANLRTVGDVWFVGTVGEEALGNLRGAKALFTDHPRIDGFISVDGVDAPSHEGRSEIVHQATGSRRWEISFTGPGGHSFENFGNPSAVHAMGRAIARIAELEVEKDPKTTFNVGVVSGGTGITSIAANATMRVDIRSNDAAELAKIEERVLAAVDESVNAENARVDSRSVPTTSLVVSERKLIGDRPASARGSDTSLVDAAVAAYLALEFPAPLLRAASTDANVPLGLGIPAATLNGGGRGDKAHSHDEWYEHVNAWQGPQVLLLTTLRLAGLQGVSKPTLAVRKRR